MKEIRFKNPEYVYVTIDKDNFIFVGIRPKGGIIRGFGFYPDSKTILQRVKIFINDKDYMMKVVRKYNECKRTN